MFVKVRKYNLFRLNVLSHYLLMIRIFCILICMFLSPFLKYNEYPNHLSLLSYDLIGLIYYLSLKDGLNDPNKLFKKKNSFKGKIGIFNVENNKINHKLNFYKIDTFFKGL